MITTLIATLLGFLGSAFPELLKFAQDKRDKGHELEILKLQMQMQASGHDQRLAEIGAAADVKEAEFITTRIQSIGVKWVDALNGSVRPILAYAFFLLYVYAKINQVSNTPWHIWTDFDEAMFAGVVSFYFGSRTINKVLGRVR